MNFEALRQTCLVCTRCALCHTRTQVVFGSGNPHARILFIGEAPGKNEDAQGVPFVGRSGQLLDALLSSISLDRSNDIFITNLVKCRPPENRDPAPKERAACLPYLQQQLAILRPKIVVCLGRIAAQRVIRADCSVMKEHGQWTEREGVFYMAMLHPAALLRSPGKKPLAVSDFLALQKKINEVSTALF